MTSMHSKVASAEKDGDQYHLVADLVLVPSEFRAIRGLQIQEGKKKPRPKEARDIEVHHIEGRLTKPQLHAVSERIAEITLNVNTTGYSRRNERCFMRA